MKNIGLLVLLLIIDHITVATWKIGTCINQSDLQVQAASYTKPKKRKIAHLTRKIKQAEKDKAAVIEMLYTVDDTSKGCSRIDLSDGYYISLDGYPSHTIMWARAKTHSNKKYIGKESLDPHKYQYGARVFLEKEGVSIPVTYAVKGYNQEGQVFNVLISGSNGTYVLSLQN